MQSDNGMYGIPSRRLPCRSDVWVSATNAFGTSSSEIPYFTNIRNNVGTSLVLNNTAANGTRVKVAKDGIYSIILNWNNTTDAGANAAIVVSNDKYPVAGNVVPQSIDLPNRLAMHGFPSATGNFWFTLTYVGFFQAGDELRVHAASGSGTPNDAFKAFFRVTEISE